MAKLSSLPQAAPLTGNDQFPIVQGTTTKRATLATFMNLLVPLLPAWIKGDPGGNVMSIGSKLGADGRDIPAGASLVMTDSYDGQGSGGAPYSALTGADATTLAAYPRSTFRAKDGRIFAMPKRPACVTEFGSRPDGSDQTPIWREAIDMCCDRGVNELTVPNVGNDPSFYLGDTINLDRAITIRGTGTGRAGANISKSRITVADGKDAFVVHTAATTPRSGQAGITGAEGTRILGLKLVGTDSQISAAIRVRARCEVADCVTEYFGFGYYSSVAAGSGGITEGNANGTSVHDCRFDTASRSNVYVGGGDVNCTLFSNLDCVGAREWGFFSAAFLAIKGVNIHTQGNGTFYGRRGGAFCGVNYIISGTYHFFVAAIGASPTDLANNAPTLDNNTYWQHILVGTRSDFPVYQPGNMNYAPGGPFGTGYVCPTTLDTCYSEADQAPSQFGLQTFAFAGTHGAGAISSGVFMGSYGGQVSNGLGFISQDPTSRRYSCLGSAAGGTLAEYYDPTNFAAPFKFQHRDVRMVAALGNGGGDELMAFHGVNSATPESVEMYKSLLAGVPLATNDNDASTKGVKPGYLYRRADGSVVARVQ